MFTDKVQAPESQGSLVPLVVLENAFRYWWILAAMLTIGGLGGLLAHSFNPSLYEAVAEFSIAVDYVSTGPLTQYSEDLAVNTAGNIFVSDEVLERVVDQAVAEGINISLLDFRSKLRLERRFSVWNIRVRDADPAVAERLAAIWMRQGEALLQQSYQHALQAKYLERYVQSQENCLEKVGAGAFLSAPCNSARFSEIQENLRDAGAALYQERQASRGIFAGLTLGPFNTPQMSAQPVTLNRNLFVFLGSMLGLLLGIVLIEWFAPKSFGTKS